ncbi:putative quinol monooxygenase [Sedimentibacter sp.]|uniref:putative quinol monooxygenase n=1 Tax=Sedimentibacter sp. TaxID=1960295 RepID=UPI0028AEAAA9|nr:putative quinol monooxygenase [Sedimentibacter sp.]
MIKVVAKGTYFDGKAEEVIELFKELVSETRKEKGCISYSLFRDVKNASILTMIEEWENREALDAHMKTEHFMRIVPIISKLRIDSELNIYELVM